MRRGPGLSLLALFAHIRYPPPPPPLPISRLLVQDVLRGKEKMSGFKNRFPAALQALKDGAAEVKRVFTESVDAIKKETQMYSAAIGLPGLIPIQYIFDRIFPSMLTAPFEGALEDALLQTARDNTQIEKLVLRKFTMGNVAPRLLEARLFDLGERDMAFDLEMSWKSEARADIDMRVSTFGTKIPITIQNLRFDGPVRLILVGLRREEPGWEALLISLPRPPQIGFDLKVAGGLLTQIPWLQSYFAKMLDKSVADEVLWPRRAVISAPSPFKAKPLLNPIQILSLMRDDPLLRMERELMASIPDDFRSSLESMPSSNDGLPQLDIRQVNGDVSARGYGGDDLDGEGSVDDDDDDEGHRGLLGRLRFWKRRGPSTTTNVATAATAVEVDAIQLMAQYLRQESNDVRSTSKMPTMLLVGIDEKRTLARRAMREILLPKSMLSYVTREGGI